MYDLNEQLENDSFNVIDRERAIYQSSNLLCH